MSTQPELIRFTEFPVGQQAEMRATVDKQLGVERTWVDAKKKTDKIAAESIYPKNPKAIQQIVEEYFNPEKEQVRNHFKK
jgi:hypothetical protein